jgi:hypothetical protein
LWSIEYEGTPLPAGHPTAFLAWESAIYI